QILAVVGLAFLLFLAGLEVEVERIRGRVARITGLGLALSAVLGLAVGVALKVAGQVKSPLFIGIVLLATSLGLVVPILKDAGESATDFGQLVIAGSTLGDFGAVILLSLFFSGQASGVGTKLILLGGFVLVVAAVGLGRGPGGAFDAGDGRVRPPGGHHRAAPGSRRRAAAGRHRGPGRTVRPGDDPGRVHGR